MYLKPLHWRSKFNANRSIYKISNKQHTMIDALINETAALLELFNEITLSLGSYAKLSNIENYNYHDIDIASSKWQPILSESCMELEKCLNNFKPKTHLKITVYAPNNVEQN